MKTPNFKVDLGLYMLLNIMKSHNESKADLARLLGVTRQNVGQIFKGDQYFTVQQIRTIAEHYSMTPEQVCECFALL